MERGNVFVVLMIFIIGIIGGVFAYHAVEGWSILNSFYFVVVTVTTIGYGDLYPITNMGKIFTMFYAFFGVAVALYLFSAISSSLFKKHVKAKVSQLKRDVKKEGKIKKQVNNSIRHFSKKKK